MADLTALPPRRTFPAAWRRLPAPAQDLLIAAAAAAAVALLIALDDRVPAGPLSYAYVLAVCAPLAVRRRLPLVAAVGCAAMVTVADWLRWPVFQGGVLVLVVGLTIASAAYYLENGRILLAAGAAAWTTASFLLHPNGNPVRAADIAMMVGVGLFPVAIGYAFRLHRDRAEQVLRLHRAQERQRKAEEREQLARDMHDTLGHHLSAIRVQAIGAQRGGSADGRRALGTIADISQHALKEVRQLLDHLREDPTIGDIPAMAARLTGTLDIAVSIVTDELPPDIELTAYRIVQESLTNTVRHSGAKHASVRIDQDPATLTITVDDDGEAGDGEPGNGLSGMAARVRAYGGTFRAGPKKPTGWRVRATIPVTP
ncbi:sensor histidine kinase [Fodinicola acaciae]|uniref:sensor histidine kinase n=1 Tax=Fodinicola acaciae TaxID=2681555 RepID=UPI0013D68CA2|nr:sensor histidine kinase [Fodinicola acaciae]